MSSPTFSPDTYNLNRPPTLQYENLLYPLYTPSLTPLAIGTSFYILLFLLFFPFTHWIAYHHAPANQKHILLAKNRNEWWFIDQFCSSPCFTYYSILFHSVPFILMIVAAVYDSWSVYFNAQIYPSSLYFGIFQVHMNEYSGATVNNGKTTYDALCASFTDSINGEMNDSMDQRRVDTICGLIRFGNYMTFICYILSCICYMASSIWLIIRYRQQVNALHHNTEDPGLWTTPLLLLLHFYGTFNGLSWLAWALVSHIGLQSLLHAYDNSDLTFHICWWLLTAATLYQFITQLLSRRSFMRHQYHIENPNNPYNNDANTMIRNEAQLTSISMENIMENIKVNNMHDMNDSSSVLSLHNTASSSP